MKNPKIKEDPVTAPVDLLSQALGSTGQRAIGPRKMKLIRRFFYYVNKAVKSGVNGDYLVKEYIGVKDWRKVKTKDIGGLISQCKEFLVISGIQ